MSSKSIAQQVVRKLQKLAAHTDDFLQRMRSCFLKWKDIAAIQQGKKKVYAVSPQLYSEIELLDTNHFAIVENSFYEHKGNAVSGSGADEWIVADEKALNRLNKMLGVKKSVNTNKVEKKSLQKVEKKSVNKVMKKSANTNKVAKKSAKKVVKLCVKQHTKKYVTRNSPPYPANVCRGMYMPGNDKNMYASLPDLKGVYRWVRM